jgi:hypothetical protein
LLITVEPKLLKQVDSYTMDTNKARAFTHSFRFAKETTRLGSPGSGLARILQGDDTVWQRYCAGNSG